MADPAEVKIGSVGPRALPVSTDGGRLGTLLPQNVRIDNVGLGLAEGDFSVDSQSGVRGQKEVYLTRTLEFARERQWHGAVISGAPGELLNPGLLEDLEAVLTIPVATAVSASISGLQAISAQRVLVLTPFEPAIEALLRDRLAAAGIEPLFPGDKPFSDYTSGTRLRPDVVYKFASQAFSAVGNAQAIYFQGPIGNLETVERLEADLRTTVISSSVAPVWLVLSRLGLRYEIRGSGKLLSEWCQLPE